MRKAILATVFVAVTAGALALGVTQSDKIKTFFASNEVYKNEQTQSSSNNAASSSTDLASATQTSQTLTNNQASSLASTGTSNAASTDTAAVATPSTATDTTTTAAATSPTATPDATATASTEASTETAAGTPAMTPVDLGKTAGAAPVKDDVNKTSSLGSQPLTPNQVQAANTAPAVDTANAAAMPADSKGTFEVDVKKALENRSVGSASAPLTVHDYSSLTCPHCAHFHNEIYPKIKEKYIDTGKVRWVFNSFPLNEPALKAEMVARCAPGGDDQYFKLTDFMFKNQERWAFTDQPVPNLNMLLKIAGVTDNVFLSCINNKELEAGLLKAAQESTEKYKIDATPSFVFNDGLKTFSGVGSYEGFADDIDHALKALAGPRAQKPLTADLPATTPPATDKK
jgi:protein-disulfide isomerase